MSVVDEVENAAAWVVTALEKVQAWTGLGGDKAAEALKLVDAAITQIKGGLVGELDPATVLENINALDLSLAANDAAAAKARADKFPNG